MKNKYTKEFYKGYEGNLYKSPQIIVPLLLSIWPAKSVIDFGCATGAWLAEFIRLGVEEINGVDGDWVPLDMLEISRNKFIQHDLRQSLHINHKYDLALCLEVAEHLPPSKADQLVEDLTRAAPVIYFSAAIPYQEGMGHLNCQWPEYWAKKFAAQNYLASDCLRSELWNNDNVQGIYKQNGILYVNKSEINKLKIEHPMRKAVTSNLEHKVHEEVYMMVGQLASLRKEERYMIKKNIKYLVASIINKYLYTI